MKKQIQSLLLAALFCGMSLPSWGQASTEGKEFWVALNMTTGTGGTDHAPFICITTQHQGGSYTITNPADPSFTPITGQIPPTGYIKIKASTSPASGEIDLRKWYPVGQTAQTVSNQIKNVGLKITTTVDCSVFAGNRLPQSFDAANILPITALQMDYITQDYPGFDHENKGGGYPVTTILATEDNTRVTIIPSSAVLNNNGTTTITKTLNAGQVLYLTGDNRASLSGTTISSNQKIAVFTGVNNTDVPGPVSARDHLYEQNMPVDYWGTHFVLTRSMKKDANRIRVTAANDGTKLRVDGVSLAIINAGETYEFELCESTMRTEEGYTKALAEGRGCDYSFDGEAHYLEASCPCAVFSYDVSENYYIKKNGTSERDDNSAGDPAMVWISPLEQQLRKVTFGVMNTDKTPTHYVNIITPTNGTTSLEVRKIDMRAGKVVYSNNLVQPSDIKTVPSNPAYSYARIKLTENAESVYTITSGVGFIAHVYGSGNKESYAYSVGSSAVKMGVNVDGYQFIDGFVAGTKFCLGHEFLFDANIGSNEVTKVDWDFGDGTFVPNGPSSTIHEYTSPGWYDVKTYLYGTPPCSAEANQLLGEVKFSFQIVEPEYKITQFVDTCLPITATTIPPMKLDTFDTDDCWRKEIHIMHYGKKTQKDSTMTVRDSHYEPLTGLTYPLDPTNPEDYHVDTTINLGPVNQYGCDSLLKLHIDIITCLSVKIPNNPESQSACEGDSLFIPFKYEKGDIGETKADINGKTVILKPTRKDEFIALPTDKLKPGKYKTTISIADTVCDDTIYYPIDYSIKYSDKIIAYKYNNVLAVYNKEFNGGYEFTAYKWFKDDDPNPVGTGPVYHTDGQMPPGSYYVLLTDKSGVTLPSCPKEVVERPFPRETTPTQAPAQKFFREQRMFIQVGDDTYDIFGRKVK